MTRLQIDDPAQRRDLAFFADRLMQRDPAAVIRLRRRPDGLVAAWAAIGPELLTCRVVRARISPPDVTCGAGALRDGLKAGLSTGLGTDAEPVDTGVSMDSAWRGSLPPETGFVHIDDVPAAVLTSLQESEALEVSDGATTVTVAADCARVLTAMGFTPEPAPPEEVVRIRATPAWLRVDARFGSVFGRRGDPVGLVG